MCVLITCPILTASLSSTSASPCSSPIESLKTLSQSTFHWGEKKKTISAGKGYFSEAGGHGNQSLIKWLKCYFVSLGWTFLNVITLMSSELVFEGYLLFFQVKIVQSFLVLVLCVSMGVCIFSVKTFWTFITVHLWSLCVKGVLGVLTSFSIQSLSLDKYVALINVCIGTHNVYINYLCHYVLLFREIYKHINSLTNLIFFILLLYHIISCIICIHVWVGC